MTNETTEGQLTPAMLEAMKSFTAGERNTYRRLNIGAAAVTVIFVILFLIRIHKDNAPVFAIFGGIGAFFFLVFLLCTFWGNWASSKAMQSTKYERVSGAMRAEHYEASMPNGSGTYTKYRLVIGGNQFPLESDIAKQLEKVNWGTAEYASYTFGRIILFEVKDANGQSVYRYPGYNPA